MKLRFLLPVLLIAFLIVGARQLASHGLVKKYMFSKDVAKCNRVAKNLRFSCYRGSMEMLYKKDIQSFLTDLKDENSIFDISFENNEKLSYAIFGTNCHTFYHAVGDYVATYSNKSLNEMLGMGLPNCTNGYTMGLYKRLALKNGFSENLLKQFYTDCKKGAENQCSHEIGHLLHDKYSYSVLKVLDNLSKTEYNLSYPQQYSYVSLKDNKVDLNKPFEDCRKIMPDDNKLAQCFTGIGHNLFLYSSFSKNGYKDMFNECALVSDENKNECYAFLVYRIGINDAAVHFMSGDFALGNKVCDDAVTLSGIESLKEHCYRGIGGGIGLFIDSKYALLEITDKNLSGVKKEFVNYMLFCEKSEKNYVESCFAGLFGTKFAKYYNLLRIYYEPIEKIRSSWDSDFEVVG